MRFDSAAYLFAFLPCAVFLFYALRTTPYRNAVLCLMSFLFYGWEQPWALLPLLFSSFVDFYLGGRILRARAAFEKRICLVFSLVLNLSLLALFKYWDSFSSMLHLTMHGTPLLFGDTVPTGVSFYTFQTLSYTLDIYRGKYKPAKRDVFDYLAFVSYFPQLVAGPIVRAGALLPQLEKRTQRLKSFHLEPALLLIGWGLVKKIVFADNLGHLIDRCREMKTVSGAGIVLALAFTFQIYCDFSAYTDIARGSAKLFGIRLQRNFMTPYFSVSPSEFWRRWHISLSSWVRDYLYIPLGGRHCSRIRNLFNLFATMLLMGAWHGAGWHFVLWGGYHGLLLAIYAVFPIHSILQKTLGPVVGKALAILIMFVLTVFGWVIFWAPDRETFFSIAENGAAFLHAHSLTGETFNLFYGLLLYALPVYLCDVLAYRKKTEFADVLAASPGLIRSLTFLAMFFAITLAGSRGSYDFIYFQF